ncbi:MAG: B12-binding domain-containing radical SAM protein, partial [Alphaproteobacteria bacterium]
MRILLIQTPNIIGTLLNLPGKEVPLSLLYLAAFLRERGHEVRLLDLDFYRGVSPHLEEAVAEFDPELAGISAYTTNIVRAAEIAAKVKNLRPEIPTLLGGFHASALPEQTMREFPVFDMLAVSEGELTTAELAARLEAGKSPAGVPGLTVREGDEFLLGPLRPLIEDLDSLPLPARDLLPITKYIPDPGNFFRLPSTAILFSRGCPYRCTFCSKSVFHDTIRYRRPEKLVEEMRLCGERWGIRDFRFEDEGPTLNKKRMRELSTAMIDADLDVTWNCFSRVDTVDEETIRLMQRAGCYHITYGVESGSERTLEKIDKRLSLEQARTIIALT